MADAPVPSRSGFKLVGGRPSVDLTATRSRRPGSHVERLQSPEDLARWFVAVGLTRRSMPVSQDDLHAAHELREALYRLLRAHLDGQAIDGRDIALVNERAAHPAPAARLVIQGDGGLAAVPAEPSATALLAAVARDGVDLLGSPLRGRIRECAGDGCTLLFVDTSRAGGRRWCSMEVCGARRKMAAYRRRRDSSR